MALPNGILFKSMFVEKFFLEIVKISRFERIGVQQVGKEVRAKLVAPGSFSVAMFRLDRFVIFAVQLVMLCSCFLEARTVSRKEPLHPSGSRNSARFTVCWSSTLWTVNRCAIWSTPSVNETRTDHRSAADLHFVLDDLYKKKRKKSMSVT